jgi:signal transduction histidine kinase
VVLGAGLLVLVVGALVGGSGSAWADAAGEAAPDVRSSSALGASSAATADPTQADVQAFVKKAVAYAGEHGKDAALAAFTAAGGEFHDGQLYIYAYDFSGTVIAHGGDPALVGRNLIGMTDPNGVHVIQELVRLARGGGGWLYYTWPNPQHGNAEEPKLGYVEKVDDAWFLGSGTYGAAAIEPPSKAEVKAFVDKAYAYVQKVGKKRAFAAFMKKDGAWFRGEQYIFADRFDGTVLCFPTEPGKVGKNLWDRRDPAGRYPIRMMSHVAREHRSGWVTYEYRNPAQGDMMQQKYSFVRRAGADWFLGSGTYRPIADQAACTSAAGSDPPRVRGRRADPPAGRSPGAWCSRW